MKKDGSRIAVPGDIVVRVNDHISKFDIKETHLGGRPKK